MHRRAMASPTYRQELDLMVVTPEGALAASCIVCCDAANRFGVFEPVGTHHEYPKLGLAKAVRFHGQHCYSNWARKPRMSMLSAATLPAPRSIPPQDSR